MEILHYMLNGLIENVISVEGIDLFLSQCKTCPFLSATSFKQFSNLTRRLISELETYC